MIFCTNLHLDESKKCFKRIFEKNSCLHQKKPTWMKNGLLTLYLLNRASDLMIFHRCLLLLMIWHECYVLKKISFHLGGIFSQKNVKNPPLWSCQILLKICNLSNLMVLNSFLMLLWPQFFCDPLGGAFKLLPKCRNPYDSDFLKVARFGWKFAFWVILCCWIHFWCYFDPKYFCDPQGGICPPQKNVEAPIWQWFLKFLDFAEKLQFE